MLFFADNEETYCLNTLLYTYLCTQLESIPYTQATPAAIETTAGAEFKGGLPVERYIDRGAIEFIIETNYAIKACKNAITVLGTINAYVCAGPNIPFEAGGAIDITMDLEKTCKTYPISPEVTDQLTGILRIEEMFQGNSSPIPHFYAKGGSVVGTVGTFTLSGSAETEK